jgi:hypothetical protein
MVRLAWLRAQAISFLSPALLAAATKAAVTYSFRVVSDETSVFALLTCSKSYARLAPVLSDLAHRSSHMENS